LYYEPQFDAPVIPDVVWFESDFGVRFGMMICFDLMFEEPQLSLYYTHGIRDFLWSSWWVDVPPLITGTQVELARSWVLPSNFLASGIGLSWYNSGSGIYSYGDPLQHWYNPSSKPIERLLIADLPIFPEVDSQPIPLITNQLLSTTKTPTIVTFQIYAGQTIENSSQSNSLRCNATLKVNPNSVEGELWGVYSLSGNYSGLFPGQVCAVMRCPDEACVDPILTVCYFHFSLQISRLQN
jgi:hypothetical protein